MLSNNCTRANFPFTCLLNTAILILYTRHKREYLRALFVPEPRPYHIPLLDSSVIEDKLYNKKINVCFVKDRIVRIYIL